MKPKYLRKFSKSRRNTISDILSIDIVNISNSRWISHDASNPHKRAVYFLLKVDGDHADYIITNGKEWADVIYSYNSNLDERLAIYNPRYDYVHPMPPLTVADQKLMIQKIKEL